MASLLNPPQSPPSPTLETPQTPPSRVLYLSNLPSNTTESAIMALLAPFGQIEQIIVLPPKSYTSESMGMDKINAVTVQALVQMENIEQTASVVNMKMLDCTATFSKSQELRTQSTGKPEGKRDSTNELNYSLSAEMHKTQISHSGRSPFVNQHSEETPNRILLLTIQDPQRSITTTVLNDVFSPYGKVEKVVIFLKTVGLQALVQFADAQTACAAKHGLDNRTIFNGCCKLIISYSKLQDLIVKENGLRTRDFTNPELPAPEHDTAIDPLHDDLVASTNQSNSTSSGSPVLLVSNLDSEQATCDALFNLFSCYGNVLRVKKLRNKPDHALIQMESHDASLNVMSHLRGFRLFRRSLDIRQSKHWYIGASRSDGETQFLREYGRSQNRFSGKYVHNTKYMYSPTKRVHISNLDPDVTQAELRQHLSQFGKVGVLKLFQTATGQQQALVQMTNVEAATDLLARAHNSRFRDRTLKIAFSRNKLGYSNSTGAEANSDKRIEGMTGEGAAA